jgi:hypothetical protein
MNDQTITKPLLVDIPAAKRLLGGICTATIYRLFETGKLEKRKVGHKTCVTLASIEALANVV